MKIPPLDVHRLLRQFNLRPNKSFGQVFLIDDKSLRRIIQVAQITPEDMVLEIGPGFGSLTRYLALTAKMVVAVELDTRLIAPLEKVLMSYSNVRLINDDILNLNPSNLMADNRYKVVANIPYYITSQVIRHLLEATEKPKNIVLTIQHEVARRICAAPGDMSLLAISVQVYGRPNIAHIIPAESFYPKPKVESAVVRIDLFAKPLVSSENLDDFFLLVKAGFSQKRKTLRNSLSAALAIQPDTCTALLRNSQIDPQRRAETLSIYEWHQLTMEYRNHISAS